MEDKKARLLLTFALLLLSGTCCYEIKGINFVGMPYTRVSLSDYRAKLSLEKLKTTGANWISIPITFFQDEKNSSLTYLATQPFLLETGVNEGISEKDLVTFVKEAKNLGLKVMLQFQAQINMPNWPESKWIGDYWVPYNAWHWFARYTENILHYLKHFEGTDIDMVSLGHDHFVLSLYENHWKSLADKVRNHTKAALTYSAAFGDEDRQSGFWESLDYVGVIPKFKSKNYEDLEVEVKEYTRTLLYMHKLWKKPVIVTRLAACQDIKNIITQESLFHIVNKAVMDQAHVAGVFFGDWAGDIIYGRKNRDASYSFQHKPAENIVRQIFGGQYREIEIPEGDCEYTLNCDCFKSDNYSQ